MSLFHYQILDAPSAAQASYSTAQAKTSNPLVKHKQNASIGKNQSGSMREYELTLITMKKKQALVPPLSLGGGKLNETLNGSFQVSLGIDFTFNTIKNVKKVGWKEDAPWYREISDGLCWICYCQNPKCAAFKQMVVVNREFGIFSVQKEMQALRCPCCSSGRLLEVRNCGFVNCEWAMRGILNRNKESKIYADGKTYDNKLYTFKECDYRTIWFALDIMVKQLDAKTAIRNIPSAREDKKKNNQMIDQALEEEGVPVPDMASHPNNNKNND